MKNIRKNIRRGIMRLLTSMLIACFLFSTNIYSRTADTNTLNQLSKVSKKIEGKKKKKKRRRRSRTKYFTLNFKDVDISEFINIMSQLLKKNIIIDDKVRGKITISSAKKIPVSQAFSVMKSILEIKGLAVVETENLIKIVPIKDAIKKNVEIIVDGKPIFPIENDNTVTYLYEVKKADARDISSALKSLKSKNIDIVDYAPLNMIIISGSQTEINALIEIAKALDKDEGEGPGESTGNIHVYHLENADAEQLANVLSRIPFSENALINKSPMTKKPTVNKSKKARRTTGTQRVAPRSKSQQKLSIISNKETNSLIISATREEYKEIMRIIKMLDIVREQVYIEALIIEVSAESGWGYGIDWMMGKTGAGGVYGGSNIGSAPDFSVSSLAGKDVLLPLSSGFQLGFLSDRTELGFVLLNASGFDKNFNILSTPQLLTTDNQEAELNIGQEIPVVSNTRISEQNATFYTWEYKSVGTKIKMTPHITKKANITLDLSIEVNSVLGTTQVAEGNYIPPQLGKRDIKTKVSVADGKTIVVGGLIRNDKFVEETKIPILGDIPILGYLFKRQSREYKKTNLMIFITPHIVTKRKKLDAITEQKMEVQRRLKRRSKFLK